MSEMNIKDLLFGPAIDGVEEADYAHMMPGVLAMAKGMEMCLHQGFCIFDCYKQEIMRISCHWTNFLMLEKNILIFQKMYLILLNIQILIFMQQS